MACARLVRLGKARIGGVGSTRVSISWQSADGMTTPRGRTSTVIASNLSCST